MEFRLATGNAGTGTYQRGTDEHGCEFVPVARLSRLQIEIPSAPCRTYAASVSSGQYSIPVKAGKRQFTIKKNMHLRTVGIFRQKTVNCGITN